MQIFKVMKLYLLLAILWLPAYCYSQEPKYFTQFKSTEYVYGLPSYSCYWGPLNDSLKIEINILLTKVVKGMECTSFELKYNGEKAVFWLGIKDSAMYCFSKNKLNKPVEMFDFKRRITELENVSFFPFTGKARVNEHFFDIVDYDRYFCVYPDEGFMLGGLCFDNFYISLHRGFFFSAKSPDNKITYDSLEEL